MLKERVFELLNHYEYGEGIMTAYDVMEELQGILDDEPHNGELTNKLQQAIDEFTLARRDYNRYAGHCSSGADEFIESVEKVVDWGIPLF